MRNSCPGGLHSVHAFRGDVPRLLQGLLEVIGQRAPERLLSRIDRARVLRDPADAHSDGKSNYGSHSRTGNRHYAADRRSSRSSSKSGGDTDTSVNDYVSGGLSRSDLMILYSIRLRPDRHTA
jgi:hypothetical protein